MTTVGQLLDYKGHEVVSISANSSVYEAIERMAAKGIGALLVFKDGKMVGIFSERDYARKLILVGRDCRETNICDIMSTNPICVSIDDTVESCMSLMTERRMRHLPVLDDGELVGIISIGDLVKRIISEKDEEIHQLEHYISSG